MNDHLSSELRIIYRDMVEGEKDLYQSGPFLFFDISRKLLSVKDNVMTLHAAADAWVCWMRSQGYEVVELPRTTRTREWGLTYSVTARGEESRVFVVSLEL